MLDRGSRKLGIDRSLIFQGRGAVVGYYARSSGGNLFAILLRIARAIVVAVASALVLVLGAGTTNRALTYSTVSVNGCNPDMADLTGTARLLLSTCQAGGVDATALGIGPVMVGDEADRLGLGHGSIRRGRRRSRLIHEKQSLRLEMGGRGRIKGGMRRCRGAGAGWGSDSQKRVNGRPETSQTRGWRTCRGTRSCGEAGACSEAPAWVHRLMLQRLLGGAGVCSSVSTEHPSTEKGWTGVVR